MQSRIFSRGLHFHLKILKTFPPEVGKTSTQDTVKNVVQTAGNMFIAWHPEPDFPYEMSKPLEIAAATHTSLLKEDAVNNAMQAFNNKHPDIAREELQRLTYTTKHIWYPRARDKKAKKTPMDRKYL